MWAARGASLGPQIACSCAQSPNQPDAADGPAHVAAFVAAVATAFLFWALLPTGDTATHEVCGVLELAGLGVLA